MRKADEIYDMYLQHGKDWGQTALQCLSRGFGFKVNASAFSTLGAKVSYHSLQKESSSFATILALLAGVSGLFSHQEVFSEDLQARVKHIMNKYGLDHHSMQAHEFRRAPVRPANAPHVRLIQLAAFLYLKPHLIDFLLLADDPEAYFSAFEQANSLVTKYQAYYKKVSKMGKSSMESIIINSVVPFQFAYAKHNANESLEQKAISLWQKMHAEQNRYTRLYMSHGFEISSSLESQGAIEQHRFFCKEGRCLQCPVGNYIMKNHQIVVI
jgi:hypothetical protein